MDCLMRHVLDTSIEQTSRVMPCSVGAVKNQTSKGLARLRALLSFQIAPTRGERSQSDE